MPQTHLAICPWPALQTLESACRYLSLEKSDFLALALRWKIDPVEVGTAEEMWRTRDLDALVRRLPTVTPISANGSAANLVRLDAVSIEKIAEAIVTRVAQAQVTAGSKPALVSVNEAVAQLGLGRTTVYELIKSGSLTVRKIGRRTMIRQESIDALVGI